MSPSQSNGLDELLKASSPAEHLTLLLALQFVVAKIGTTPRYLPPTAEEGAEFLRQLLEQTTTFLASGRGL